MKLKYFAWVRQRAGTGSETVDVPPEVSTVAELVGWLRSRSPGLAEAFQDTTAIRCAVNQTYVEWDHPVAQNDEVAFFPPVTGG
ncbi:MAG: molybdopterin converting factor subunit 1 [Alphaproteobacteria bacterium]|nr:molybdopterin converting factor subunit 1 [Alphaproteobacteria bacterium]